MKTLFSIVQGFFFLTLVGFLLGGLAIILTQTFGIITTNGSIVVGVEDWLAPATFICATLCAVSAFILNYRPDRKTNDE
ncbi:hypothetical protein [Corynebacterium camporealensis]